MIKKHENPERFAQIEQNIKMKSSSPKLINLRNLKQKNRKLEMIKNQLKMMEVVEKIQKMI